MPQLDISTYLPQIFWLAIIFSLMFGVFVGIFLPKISRIFQKRSDSKKRTNNELFGLQQNIKELQHTYTEKKDAEIKKNQILIDQEIKKINQAQESRIQNLENEIYNEISQLQTAHKLQEENFEENFGEIIEKSVVEILSKMGMHHGR